MTDELPSSATPPVFAGRGKFPLPVEVRREGLKDYLRVTCERSAALRGRHPFEELKSILFQSKNLEFYVMAHVPGDMRVDEKALADEVGPLQMVPQSEMARLGLEKGRVNPFTAELYLTDKPVIHVLCPLVFQIEQVHSNNDSVGGWITFRPQDVIHWVEHVRVHRISKTKKTQKHGESKSSEA